MKYIMTFVWGFILSQVTFYLGSALSQSTYNFTAAVIVGIAVSLAVICIQHFFLRPNKSEKNIQ